MNSGDNLLEYKGGQWKCTPLYNAVYYNKTDDVKALLEKDAGRAILTTASWDGGYTRKFAFSKCSVFHQCISNWNNAGYTRNAKAKEAAQQVFCALMEHAKKGLEANKAEEYHEMEYPKFIQNIKYLTKVVYHSHTHSLARLLPRCFSGAEVNYDIYSY